MRFRAISVASGPGFLGGIVFPEAYPRSARFESMQFVSSIFADAILRAERSCSALFVPPQTGALFGETYRTVSAEVGGLTEGSPPYRDARSTPSPPSRTVAKG
jgi:hypothetical protein